MDACYQMTTETESGGAAFSQCNVVKAAGMLCTHTQIMCKSGEPSFSSTLTFAFLKTRALNKKLPRVTPAFFGCSERERILVLERPSSFTSGNSGNYSIVGDFCDSKWHRTEH